MPTSDKKLWTAPTHQCFSVTDVTQGSGATNPPTTGEGGTKLPRSTEGCCCCCCTFGDVTSNNPGPS